MGGPWEDYKAKTESPPWEDYSAPEPKKASFGTSVKSMTADAISAMDQAISLPAGALASMFSQEQGDQLFRDMDEREASRKRWANPDNLETTLGNDLGAIGVTLPLQLPAIVGQAARKGVDLIRKNEPLSTAIPATLADTALNAAGMGPMAAAKTVAGRAAIGAGANMAFGGGSDAITQALATQQETKDAYDPYDPKRRLLDAATGGVLQGALGERPTAASTPAQARKAVFEEAFKEPTKETKPVEKPIERLTALEDADKQMSLWDIDESVQARHPYQAEFGDWRVDENGIPIRADLSMEAQFDQTPLQRDMFVDANGNFAKMQDTGYYDKAGNLVETPTKSMQSAMDDMFWAEKRGALNKSGLMKGEMEAEGPLKAAAMEAERSLPFNYKRQGGAIDPDVFVSKFPDFAASKLKDAAGQLKKFYHGTSKDQPIKDLKAGSRGAWFVDDPKEASSYANENDSKTLKYNPDTRRYDEVNTSAQVHEVYLNAKNIYQLSPEDIAQYSRAGNYAAYQRTITAKAKSLGYDAIDWGKGVVSVFDAKQIKSAISPEFIKSQRQSRGQLFMGMGKDAKKAEMLSKIPGIMKKMPGIFPDMQKTTEQIIEEARTTNEPDVSQNFLQKGLNYLTKGALYQAEKTGNSFVRHTAHTWLGADRKARGTIQQNVHEGLAPAFRNLNRVETAEVGTIMNLADLHQKEVTPAMMADWNLSPKEIKALEVHRQVMDNVFEAINRARATNGKDPIDRRVAYAMMRATGDYKRLVYQLDDAGEKKVVGIVGSDFRPLLNQRAKDLAAKGYTVGDEQPSPYGRTKAGKASVMQLMEHLADDNPATKDFLNVLAEIDQQNAYNYLNAKKHTKAKKGIFGMEGRKPWLTDYQNAKELMTSQLIYAENAFRWAELSEAMAETKKILSSEVDQPNAKQWIQQYTDNALGINPTKTGQALENTINSFFHATGVGPSNVGKATQALKFLTNTILLSWNPLFLASQVVQPVASTPGLASFLAGKGIESTALGYTDLGKANLTVARKQLSPSKLTAVEKGAFEYAKTHAVYQAELVDTSTRSQKDPIYYVEKAASFPTAHIEMASRLMIYMANVHKLSEAGVTAKDGLYQAAHNLTDMALTNYSKQERPQAFNALGVVGEMGVNLMAFKHNELSKLAMFARAAKEDKNLMPVMTQLLTYVVFAGVAGVAGFQELDTLYHYLTKTVLDKPRSLTLDVVKVSEKFAAKANAELGAEKAVHPNLLSHGSFSSIGLQMSNRLGMSNIAPDNIADLLFPGVSKLGAIAGAGIDLAKDPSEYNAKNLARESIPIGLTGPMDRAWFSRQTPAGEMGINRKDPSKPGVIRNEEDKFWKNLGGTGINESVGKLTLWEVQRLNMPADERRDALLKSMVKAMHTNSDIKDYIEKYIAAEGDPQTLERTLQTKLLAGQIDAMTAAKIKAAAAKTRPDMFKAQRTLEAIN